MILTDGETKLLRMIHDERDRSHPMKKAYLAVGRPDKWSGFLYLGFS
jgi:hypothetical protein